MPFNIHMAAACCVLAVCSGCATISSRDDFLRGGSTLAGFGETPDGVVNLAAQVRGEPPPKLGGVQHMLGASGGPIVAYAKETRSLAKVTGMGLENDPVLLKLTQAITPDGNDDGPRKVTISAWEMKNFTEKLVRGLGAFDSNEEMLAEIDRALTADASRVDAGDVAAFSAGSQVRLTTILAAYLKEYLSGKFVDRAGNEIPKPKLGKTVGNDVIIGFETVLLEACFDYAYLTPALYVEGDMEYDEAYVGPLNADVDVVVTPDGGAAAKHKVRLGGNDRYFVQVFTEKGKPRVFNKEKKRPTFVKVLPTLVAAVSTNSQTGVTALEREAIDFACNLGSLGSQQLSGLITRLFGGIDIGFVILGKVSVGDNDTVAKAVETFAEVTTRRYLEARGYDTFDRFIYTEHKTSTGKVDDVYLTDHDRDENGKRNIKKAKADALILILRVQLKLHGLLG